GTVAVDPAIGLLEHQAGGERKRARSAEAASQEAAQDQHAFGMQRPAQRDLALDIDDLALAKPDARADSAGMPERKAAKPRHRQAVYLADALARRFDAQRVAGYLFLQTLINAVPTAALGIDRRLQLCRADLVLFFHVGQVVRFLQEISQMLHLRRELFCIAAKA